MEHVKYKVHFKLNHSSFQTQHIHSDEDDLSYEDLLNNCKRIFE